MKNLILDTKFFKGSICMYFILKKVLYIIFFETTKYDVSQNNDCFIMLRQKVSDKLFTLEYVSYAFFSISFDYVPISGTDNKYITTRKTSFIKRTI